MGYTRSALLLEWDPDSEFAELKVRMKRISIKQLMRIEALSDLRKSGSTEEAAAAMVEILDVIGKGLLGWNLEEERVTEVDGAMVATEKVAVPAVRESLDDLDLGLIRSLISVWTKTAAGVPLGSRPSSPTGVPEPPDAEWASYLATSQESLPAPVSS